MEGAYLLVYCQMSVYANQHQTEGPTDRQPLETDRSDRMKAISRELDSIMDSVFTQDEDETHMATLAQLQQEQSRQMHSLRIQQQRAHSQFELTLHLDETRIRELEHEQECLKSEQKKLQAAVEQRDEERAELSRQLKKAQEQIRNQQLLIEEYKTGLQEQIDLEKETIKQTLSRRLKETKAKLDKALQAMRQNYQQKIQNIEGITRKNIQSNLLSTLKACQDRGKENYASGSRNSTMKKIANIACRDRDSG